MQSNACPFFVFAHDLGMFVRTDVREIFGQYGFQCLFRTVAHLHPSGCQTAVVWCVWQECPIKIAVAHFLPNAERKPRTTFMPIVIPCQMLNALRASCMA